MSGYIPIGKKERRELLASVGLALDHLFDAIPDEVKFKPENLSNLLPEGLSEAEILARLTELAERNARVDRYDSYLGAGYYDHYVPAVIPHLLSRQEFLTSYTPYQAEISQGTLQAIFEWQSYICRLTGMDIANSSMYDGASAAAEALLLACRQTRKTKIWVSEGVNPQYLAVIKTYFKAAGLSLEIGSLNDQGTAARTYPEGDAYAAVMIQSPNFFGLIEDLEDLANHAQANQALSAVVCDPISLAIFKSPGDLGVDIACGEAQPLGVALNFGGPAVGFLAAKQTMLRKMPGRIAGQTIDREGKTAYVLTIQAREQHIRREKATSNICTNQALLATGATIYLALNGSEGLRQVATQTVTKSVYLQQRLLASGNFEAVFDQPFFREFAVRLKEEAYERVKLAALKDTNSTQLTPVEALTWLNHRLLADEIIGGLPLEGGYWLLAVTETKSKTAMDRMVDRVTALIGGE